MTLTGLDLPIDDWLHRPDATHSQRWQHDGDVLDVTWLAHPPTLPALEDIAAVRAELATQAATNRAALIDCRILQVAGCPTVYSIIKLRDPHSVHGYLMYVGALLIIDTGPSCVIRVQASETGFVGLREALVVAMNPHLNIPFRADVEANAHLQAMLKTKPILPHPADNPEYDTLVPTHPLSRVRRILAQIVTTNQPA